MRHASASQGIVYRPAGGGLRSSDIDGQHPAVSTEGPHRAEPEPRAVGYRKLLAQFVVLGFIGASGASI